MPNMSKSLLCVLRYFTSELLNLVLSNCQFYLSMATLMFEFDAVKIRNFHRLFL